MKSGWWKIEFVVTVNGIEVNFDELPTKTKQQIMKQVSQGAVAGAFEMEERA